MAFGACAHVTPPFAYTSHELVCLGLTVFHQWSVAFTVRPPSFANPAISIVVVPVPVPDFADFCVVTEFVDQMAHRRQC